MYIICSTRKITKIRIEATLWGRGKEIKSLATDL